MNFDQPFPIDRCSKRVANALLREFEGRVPTIAEVLAYRDNDWLGTPGFGRKALDEIKEIKSALDSPQPALFRPKISDAELLLHLNGLVQDMEAIIGKISQRNGTSSGSQGGG
ncbi:DNA-directed RNA polymerase subunit alpha C-terminal domain-containing protein [Microvirga antarctica]|uniref:DNA-directed RNA polymerase subunit alpha C-terminal domain-containing protein n=1 Tax=Microvirga antarctica TaxID=2819233 RepID=UPI001B31188D|nr:DNA-directed RNA polymerase subunit alpha C-terminal domain-containing protein [Microvirga antarctica]